MRSDTKSQMYINYFKCSLLQHSNIKQSILSELNCNLHISHDNSQAKVAKSTYLILTYV